MLSASSTLRTRCDLMIGSAQEVTICLLPLLLLPLTMYVCQQMRSRVCVIIKMPARPHCSFECLSPSLSLVQFGSPDDLFQYQGADFLILPQPPNVCDSQRHNKCVTVLVRWLNSCGVWRRNSFRSADKRGDSVLSHPIHQPSALGLFNS